MSKQTKTNTHTSLICTRCSRDRYQIELLPKTDGLPKCKRAASRIERTATKQDTKQNSLVTSPISPEIASFADVCARNALTSNFLPCSERGAFNTPAGLFRAPRRNSARFDLYLALLTEVPERNRQRPVEDVSRASSSRATGRASLLFAELNFVLVLSPFRHSALPNEPTKV